MRVKIKSDRILYGGGLYNGYLYLDGGRVAEVSARDTFAEECYDFTGKYVSPGFIDLHTHGGGGHAFADTDAQEVMRGSAFHLAHGTTAILPTVSADEFPRMVRSLSNISEAMKECPNIIGAHLEGPYLSPAQCGAQCPSFITPPEASEYEETLARYRGVLRRWTYAPENDKDGAFCRAVCAAGVIASAGHTNAVYADMERAIAAGCRLVTHLYSCTSTVTRDHGYRSLGVIESTFLRDELFAEIIADGKHLPPELIRMILKVKGEGRVILCTDSLSVAGSGEREGVMCGTPFIVEDGVAKLPDRTAFAGSIATADVLLRVLTKECGVGVPSAVRMLTENPARLMGLQKGSFREGYDGDVAVFDGDIAVTDVFLRGKKVK